MTNPTFAILIPAHNEAADIRRTLDSALAVRPANRQIVVIDDASTDNTPQIVEGYADRGVRLVRMPANHGVAAARNEGLRATDAGVVVILNADVILPPDIIERLQPHYANGADFVVVDSRPQNMGSVFARYVESYHHIHYRANPAPGNYDWSEGWSCRRQAALAVGGFPEEFRGASGEDAIFVQRLLEYGGRRVYDPNIVVTHYVPDTLKEFWKQRLGRGRGIAYRRFGYEKVTPRLLPMLRAWAGALLWLGTIILPLSEAWRLAGASPKGWCDLPGMFAAVALNRLGHQLGYWLGYLQMKS